jgi:hypothetical protein
MLEVPIRLAMLAALAGALGEPSLAGAQGPYAVRACGAPAEPLGVIHAEGVLRFTITNEGRADTATVDVLAVRGMSVAGFRSASVRQLSACRFDRTKDPLDGDKHVVSAMRLDSATTVVTPATPASGAESPLPVGARPGLPADPVEATDSIVEERPRRLDCDRPPPLPLFTGSFRTIQDRDAAYQAFLRQNSGTASARVTVGFDGRVVPGGVVIMASTNPMLHDVFVGVLSTCRFVPGRIGGVTVMTIVATTMGLNNRGGLP